MIYSNIAAAGMDTLRDDRGNEIEVKLIGIDGQLMENAEGVAITKRKWDDKSRVLIEAYYNRHAKLVRRAGLVAWLAVEYDDEQGTEEWRYNDERGLPCMNADGVLPGALSRKSPVDAKLRSDFSTPKVPPWSRASAFSALAAG